MNENFGFTFAESQTENTPASILGEANLKSYVEREINSDALILGKYNALERVAQLRLLKVTAESGLLSALEAKGITLADLEAALPYAEDLGLVGWAADNVELLKVFLPLLIEPAPLLLPLLPKLVGILPISGGNTYTKESSSMAKSSGPKKTEGGLRILAPGKTVTKPPPIGLTGLRTGYATATSVQDLTGDDEVRFPGSDFLGISTPTKKAVAKKKVVTTLAKGALNTPARAKPTFVTGAAYSPPARKAPVRKAVAVQRGAQPVAPKVFKAVAVKKVAPKPVAKKVVVKATPKPVAKKAPVPVKKVAPKPVVKKVVAKKVVVKAAPKPVAVAKKAAPKPVAKKAAAAGPKFLTKPMGGGR